MTRCWVRSVYGKWPYNKEGSVYVFGAGKELGKILGGVSLELSPDKHVGGYTEWDRVGRAACGLLQSGVPSRRSWWEAKLETEAGADYRGPGKPQ